MSGAEAIRAVCEAAGMPEPSGWGAFFDVVQYWISPQLVFWLTGRRLAADLSEAVWDAMVLFLASLPALPAGLFIFWLVARSDRETS